MTIEADYTLSEVAEALRMSERWLRKQIAEGAEHQRYGHKIRFTGEQVEKLRSALTKSPVDSKTVTTGRKRGR